MDFNIEVRKKQLQSLDQYITSSKDKVQSILDYLEWDAKRVLEKKPYITCSVNPSHKLPLESIEQHSKNCYVKTAGYDINDTFLPEPLHDDPSSSIRLDNAKKIEILGQARHNNQRFKAAWNGQEPDPMTSDRLFSTFSCDERLTLYDYCVKNSQHPPTPSEFDIHTVNKKEEKLMTQEELLAKERDAKRRRIKYKSVHTSSSKSHTEVIKEVIEHQMELYKEYLASKEKSDMYPDSINENDDQIMQQSDMTNINSKPIDFKEKPEHVERPHSSISRHSTHSGSSRSKSNYEYQKEYHKNGEDHKRKNKEYDRKRGYDSKYDHSSYKEKRREHRDYREDYRPHSRDKRERYYKSDRRH